MGFFNKSDQIRSVFSIWLYLLKKSLMENFIFVVQCNIFVIIHFVIE